MKTYFVDAFSDELFKGNTAAVCITDDKLPEVLMQKIAAEIGFSETAFIQQTSSNGFSIRFFSPQTEIPLCGHATVAAAKVIFVIMALQEVSFVNAQGLELPATSVRADDGREQVRMSFPVYDTEKIRVAEAMLKALGLHEISASVYNAELRIIMLEIDSTRSLQILRPDFAALVKSQAGINGVLVTAKDDAGLFDFHYRYFWPWSGGDEDPATGAVQTFLTKYWADKLRKTRLRSFQSSARTGNMITQLVNDRVFIYGDAVIVLEGQFLLNGYGN